MGAGFVGNNTTIKIVSGGAAVSSLSAGVAVFSTASNQYAEVTVFSNTAALTIGSATNVVPTTAGVITFTVGPSSSLRMGSGAGNVSATWTIFQNSP